MMYQKIIRGILLFFVFVVLAGIIFWGVMWFSGSVQNISSGKLSKASNIFSGSLATSIDNASASAKELSAQSPNLLPYRNWQVPDLKLESQSAISVEFGEGVPKVLFKKNEEEKLPVASLTKLMTALVVLDAYDLSQPVTISFAAMAQEGEQGVLQLGQVLSVRDLLYITLMESSNRSAYALAEVMGTEKFIANMNADARKLGLLNTHFQDATGLDLRSFSSAEDVATLTQYLFERYPLFYQIVSLKQYNMYLPDGSLHHTLINTNKLLGENEVIGGKTGFTVDAKGFFMTIQNSKQKGSYIINIVLGAKDRFGDMKSIIDWMNTGYQWQ